MLRSKISCVKFLLNFLSEFMSTTILVFFGCMTSIKYGNIENSSFQISLNVGLLMMTIIQIFGCVSGAYMNPSLTIAALIYKLITWQMAIVYFIAQMLGGIVGFGLLKVLIPNEAFYLKDATSTIKSNSCLTIPRSDLHILQAVAIEFIITMILILLMCSIWDPRNPKYQETVPLKVGLCIAVLINGAGPFTGASMNTARSFGPALWNWYFEHNWIYWVSPLSAATLSALFYKYVIYKEAELEEK